MAPLLLADLVLHELGLNLEVGELLAQALSIDAQLLALLLAQFDVLLKHDGALDGHIVLGLEVLERRGRVARLALKVVVGHLDIAELQLQRPIRVAKRRDLLLECVLGRRGLAFGLFIFALNGSSAGCP